MAAITEDLLKELKNTVDLETFFNSHEKDFLTGTTADYLNDLMTVKNTTVSNVAKNSGVGEYLYKIFGGERNPSRDILISVSFGMRLSLDEAQLLLRISKFAVLDPRDKRDSIIIYGLTHGLSVFQTDDLLHEKGLGTLN